MQAIFSALEKSALDAAPALLNCVLVHNSSSGRTAGRIVEVEAYMETDAASHTYRGQTPRNSTMYKKAGHLYTYFTYGMHWCANIVTGPEGSGEAVLIRALEPIEGISLMQERRHTLQQNLLCNGPAKLTQAMGIGKAENGIWLGEGSLQLQGVPYTGSFTSGPRIGISSAQEKPWRFWLPDSPFLSR